MFVANRRIHVQEVLDAGVGSDAEVAQSLADLRRINRFLGGRCVLRKLLGEQVRRTGLRAFSLLDVATGSGDLPAAVRRWYPQARVTALELHLRHLRLAETPQVGLVCGDAFRAPFATRSFDFVAVSLFLHHLPDVEVPDLLHELARLARRALLINDLDRHWVPFYFLRWTAPLFARSRITRFDGPASVQRAFGPGELERAAGAAGFRHFCARWHMPFRRSLVVELE